MKENIKLFIESKKLNDKIQLEILMFFFFKMMYEISKIYTRFNSNQLTYYPELKL